MPLLLQPSRSMSNDVMIYPYLDNLGQVSFLGNVQDVHGLVDTHASLASDSISGGSL